MSNSPRRPIVALNLPKSHVRLRTHAQAVAEALTNNPRVPSPIPTVAELQKQIDAFQAAEVATGTHAPGTAEARNVERKKLVVLLQQEGAYVQSVADANPDDADAIIRSAGMFVKNARGPSKMDFAVKLGRVSGEVILVARAIAARAVYEWSYSLDEKTWISAHVTLQAHATIAGLTPGATYFFRFRATDKTGEKDWSRVISCIVH